MHRPGSNELDMTAEDFLCDFCASHWAPDRPMVEGHRGSLVCGPCLSVAYAAVVHHAHNDRPEPGETCVLCLAEKQDPHWRSPVTPAHPLLCAPCIEQAARKLEKDRDCEWSRPTA